jgi:tetratricopeptide (TPR) repeat protein
MPDLFISVEQAEADLLACAAFLGERIRSHTGHAEAMKVIVPRLIARGEVDLAAELANAVQDPFSRDKLLITVAAACAELDDDEYALQLADAIEDHGMQAEAMERIGMIKAAKGQVDKATEIARSMTHPENVLAAVAVDLAKTDRAAAESTIDSIEYPNARLWAFQQIARSEIDAEEPDKALPTLSQAVEAAGEIDHEEETIRGLCDVATLYIEAGSNEKAIETFTAAQEATEMLDSVHRDFSFVACGLGFLYAGDEERADLALDMVTDKTQMSSALVGFARTYWESDRKEDALDALEESYAILKSQRDFETRDTRARNALLASVAAQFAAFDKADRGTEIALENVDHDEKVAALRQIAQVLTLGRNDDLARQTINLIDEDADRLFALIALSDAKKRLGEAAAAVALLDEAADLAETVPQLAARSSVLNSIAGHYATHGETQKCLATSMQNLELIAGIRDESSQAASLANVADTLFKAGVEVSDEGRRIIDGIVRDVDRPH